MPYMMKVVDSNLLPRSDGLMVTALGVKAAFLSASMASKFLLTICFRRHSPPNFGQHLAAIGTRIGWKRKWVSCCALPTLATLVFLSANFSPLFFE